MTGVSPDGHEGRAVIKPVAVYSRAEFEEYLQANPLRLRAGRVSPGPRVGHPAFIGPIDPAILSRQGFVQHDDTGGPFVLLNRPKWLEKRDQRLIELGVIQ